MNYIVIEVCCLDCLKFENLIVVNCKNIDELKQYLKIYSRLHDNCFFIYDEEGNLIEICNFWR